MYIWLKTVRSDLSHLDSQEPIDYGPVGFHWAPPARRPLCYSKSQ